jgi:hypothetical protein
MAGRHSPAIGRWENSSMWNSDEAGLTARCIQPLDLRASELHLLCDPGISAAASIETRTPSRYTCAMMFFHDFLSVHQFI